MATELTWFVSCLLNERYVPGTLARAPSNGGRQAGPRASLEPRVENKCVHLKLTV
jgi:hypothetical protein